MLFTHSYMIYHICIHIHIHVYIHVYTIPQIVALLQPIIANCETIANTATTAAATTAAAATAAAPRRGRAAKANGHQSSSIKQSGSSSSSSEHSEKLLKACMHLKNIMITQCTPLHTGVSSHFLTIIQHCFILKILQLQAHVCLALCVCGCRCAACSSHAHHKVALYICCDLLRIARCLSEEQCKDAGGYLF